MEHPYSFTPAARPVPLLFSSPHSGRDYPPDWATQLTRAELRLGEDAYVDELLAGCADAGVGLLAARLPRCYIDLNRDADDIDPAMIAGDWPGELRPSEKSRLGLGLIRRYVTPGLEINAARLAVAEVERRIATVWRPYHARLQEEMARLAGRFGKVWLVDWHSMKSRGNAMTPDGAGAARPDFVLGDRDGSSAEPAMIETAARVLQGLGYRVALNDPYKGGAITRRYGAPAQGRHVLQIEMNRALYLDEASVTRSAGFAGLAAHLATLTAALVAAM